MVDPNVDPAFGDVPAPGNASALTAAAVVIGVVAANALVGRRNAPDGSRPEIDRWYDRLAKPPFTPPDPVFGAVWPALETALAVSGYRLLCQPASPARNAALGLWFLDTGKISGWSVLYFRQRELGASAVAAGAMTAAGAACGAIATEVDRGAALAGVPYAAGWVSRRPWRRRSGAATRSMGKERSRSVTRAFEAGASK